MAKAKKPKPTGRDPGDVLYDFAMLEERAGEEGWLSLHREVVALLKKAKREGQTGPVPPHYINRMRDEVVMAKARKRYAKIMEKTRGQRAARDHALDDASEYAAATDRRLGGKRLTPGAIRHRLTHPGEYPPPPSPYAIFAERKKP